jgi:ABC-type multidrug transport system ATPase subunit
MSRRSRTRASRPVVDALVVEDLHKDYGGVPALAPLDLSVPEGQSVVLVGHNGSGKSTLLSMVAGTLEPSGGDVRIFGRSPDDLPARAARSWLPDTPVLYDDLSVREHLEYVDRMHGGDGAGPHIEDLIDRLGLRGREDDLPSQFSRGLRQKAAIAVALCRPLRLLLVDEPFVGLDTAGRTAFLELLDEVRADGATILVATHDPAVIDRFERGIMLADGEVVHDGAASELPALLSPDDRQGGA